MKRKAPPCDNGRSIRPEIRDGSPTSSSHMILSLLASYQQSQQQQQQQQQPQVPPNTTLPPPVGVALSLASSFNSGLTANTLPSPFVQLQGPQPAVQPTQENPGNQVLSTILQQLLVPTNHISNANPIFAPAPAIPPQQWPVQLQTGALVAGMQTGTPASDPTADALQRVIQLLQPLISSQAPPPTGSSFLPVANQPLSTLVTPQPSPSPMPAEVAANAASMVNRDMSLTNDTFYLPKYQAYLRSHLEFFATDLSEANTTVQGRKRKIRHRQVGIRCRHCNDIPVLLRGKGAVYYPQRLAGVYQASLNMGNYHLLGSCLSITAEDRAKLEAERKRKLSGCGGKIYWLEACKRVGLEERDDAIWFQAH